MILFTRLTFSSTSRPSRIWLVSAERFFFSSRRMSLYSHLSMCHRATEGGRRERWRGGTKESESQRDNMNDHTRTEIKRARLDTSLHVGIYCCVCCWVPHYFIYTINNKKNRPWTENRKPKTKNQKLKVNTQNMANEAETRAAIGISSTFWS